MDDRFDSGDNIDDDSAWFEKNVVYVPIRKVQQVVACMWRDKIFDLLIFKVEKSRDKLQAQSLLTSLSIPFGLLLLLLVMCGGTGSR